MNALELITIFFVGLVGGLLFFGCLRWAVSQFKSAQYPIAIYVASLLIRFLLVFGLVIWALQISVIAVLIGLCGFTVARVYATRVSLRSESIEGISQ